MLDDLTSRRYEIAFHSHAAAILERDFPEVLLDVEAVLKPFSIQAKELVAGGGGETAMTQRLRHGFNERGWKKTNFEIQRIINGRPSGSISHEVDHVKSFDDESIALEIEWNNKDPFFDRDLENFKRLHLEGAIAAGVIVTRGASFQANIRSRIERFAIENGIVSVDDLSRFGVRPTDRQRNAVRGITGTEFAHTWAGAFTSDKFGESTTHWRKLQERVERRVGHPCPLVLIGIPEDVIA